MKIGGWICNVIVKWYYKKESADRSTQLSLFDPSETIMVKTNSCKTKATKRDMAILSVVSSAITDRKAKHRRVDVRKQMFAMAKDWSGRDESSPDKEHNRPLLDFCAVTAATIVSHSWYHIRNKVHALHPIIMEKELKQNKEQLFTATGSKLAGLFAMGGLPGWMVSVGREVSKCCDVDLVLNVEMDVMMKELPENCQSYNEKAEKRRANIQQMNRCTSCVAVFAYLTHVIETCRIDDHPSFAVVSKAFKKHVGSPYQLERFCQVMDVEARTRRHVQISDEPAEGDNPEHDQGVRVSYSLAPNIPPGAPGDEGLDGISCFWDWFGCAITLLHSSGVVCTDAMYDYLMASVERICSGDGVNGDRSEIMVLVDWKLGRDVIV